MEREAQERIKETVKVGGMGAVAGALVWWWVLAHPLGWISASTAKEQADQASQNAVASAIAPLCADQVMANKDAWAKYQNAQGFDQDSVVQDTVKKIGNVKMDYTDADACTTVLNARIKAAKSKTNQPSKT